RFITGWNYTKKKHSTYYTNNWRDGFEKTIQMQSM
ncbi:unnamed protein product, partial [marine sediment metagenome]